ncbi:MAG: glycosyltransferase family 4 protein [Fibrobacterota bacterium]
MEQKNNGIKKIAFIGNYLPRQCGIATFTTDLCESVAGACPDIQCFAVPVTDIPEGYDYPDRVRFEIKAADLDSYDRAADFLNISNVDVVCLQHEYGIYGGAAGSFILTLLRKLTMPVVTTLHTVLRNPNAQQQRVMAELVELSDAIIVMTARAVDFLKTIYRVPENKIRLIPHGIHDVPFLDPNFYKDQFSVEGKIVVLTFGLLSEKKGIEHVIQALPEVIRRFPNVVYLVLGATHPNLIRSEGEIYRLSLERLAGELEVEKNVIFINRFVTLEELKEFIVAADIYITPYLDEEQITSGTLAYSFGAGNAVVSTPYWHAAELLNQGRGILVPFKDPGAIAKAILRLVGNETERHALRKNAYLYGRDMVWGAIAERYCRTFEEARLKRPTMVKKRLLIPATDGRKPDLPKIKLDHLFRMTDSTGLFQHAAFTVPNFEEGYTTDDNARALILMILLEELGGADAKQLTDNASTYLAFLKFAFDHETGRFRNFMSFERTWTSVPGSEDSHGRSLWALGTCIGRTKNTGFQNLAGQLFELALPPTYEFTSLRSWAFTLIGIHEYLRRFDGDWLVSQGREFLAVKLFKEYTHYSGPDWPWFEPTATYCNAKLPHALILSGRWLGRKDMLQSGLDALDWLLRVQTAPQGFFHSIGSNGFFPKGGKPAPHDQQPIEAHAMVSACLEAYRTTKDTRWYDGAWKTFQWFLGRNSLGLPLYDSKTGGCHDALHMDRVNQNEGAESSLAFCLSLVEMELMENTMQSLKEPQS